MPQELLIATLRSNTNLPARLSKRPTCRGVARLQSEYGKLIDTRFEKETQAKKYHQQFKPALEQNVNGRESGVAVTNAWTPRQQRDSQLAYI